MAARIIHRRSAGLSPVTSPTQQPLVQQSRMPRDERKPKAPRRWPVALIACLVVSAVLCTGMLVLLRPWMALDRASTRQLAGGASSHRR